VTIGKCTIAKELAVNSGVGVLTQKSKFVNSPLPRSTPTGHACEVEVLSCLANLTCLPFFLFSLPLNRAQT